jgi:hypothetical protein
VSSTFSSPRNDFAASAAAPSPPVFQSKLVQSFARPSVDSSFVRPLLVITLLLCVDLLCWLFDLSLWIACELLQGEIGVILELSDKNFEFFRS